MTRLEEMLSKRAALIEQMQSHIDADRLDDAEQKKKEIEIINAKISKQIFLDELNSHEFEKDAAAITPSRKTKEDASFIRAAIKKIGGKPLTEAEDALLLPTTTYVNGANGEGYILPQDIQTKINEKIRAFNSFRDVCGYMQTTALKGSFPIENLDSLTGLVDFDDGTDGTLSNDISFSQVSFALREKAAFVKLSNTLLALTDNNLIAYIVRVFAKKAVITENTMAKAAIEYNKTVKTFANWNDFKKSLNVDLDPAALNNTVIVTNQDGFNYFDEQTDDIGRPLLQPAPTQPTSKILFGYPVKVFSNTQLPSTAATAAADGFAPLYYGDIEDGVKFIDLGTTAFAASSEAGFLSHTTIARLIEFIDVVQCDASDACYCCGQVKVAEKTS